MTAAQMLERLEKAIERRLGPMGQGVRPLLDEARKHLSVLEPGPGERRPSPKEQQEHHVELRKVLNQMEDVLEALNLSVSGGHRSEVNREGRP